MAEREDQIFTVDIRMHAHHAGPPSLRERFGERRCGAMALGSRGVRG